MPRYVSAMLFGLNVGNVGGLVVGNGGKAHDHAHIGHVMNNLVIHMRKLSMLEVGCRLRVIHCSKALSWLTSVE